MREKKSLLYSHILYHDQIRKRSIAYLFNKINCWLKIQTKVDELPFDSFPLVLLLLEDEHLKKTKTI